MHSDQPAQPEATQTIRVGVVDDDNDLRQDLIRAMADTTDLLVAGDWGTAEEVLSAWPEVRPEGIHGAHCGQRPERHP